MAREVPIPGPVIAPDADPDTPPPSWEEVKVKSVATLLVTNAGLTENECTFAFTVAVAVAAAPVPAGGVTDSEYVVVLTTLLTAITMPEITGAPLSVPTPPAKVGLRNTLPCGSVLIADPLFAVPPESVKTRVAVGAGRTRTLTVPWTATPAALLTVSVYVTVVLTVTVGATALVEPEPLRPLTGIPVPAEPLMTPVPPDRL